MFSHFFVGCFDVAKFLELLELHSSSQVYGLHHAPDLCFVDTGKYLGCKVVSQLPAGCTASDMLLQSLCLLAGL